MMARLAADNRRREIPNSFRTLFFKFYLFLLLNRMACSPPKSDLTVVYSARRCLSDFSSNYTYRAGLSQSAVECVKTCLQTENCGHVVFCPESLSCLMEDYTGSVFCGQNCSSCRCYQNAQETEVVLNGTCEASSTYGEYWGCAVAFNGLPETYRRKNSWATRAEGVGAWIKIYLAGPAIVRFVRLMQRWGMDERNKDIELLFSDGSTQTFTLPFINENGAFWDDLRIRPVKTSWVKITVLSVFSKRNNGWAQIILA